MTKWGPILWRNVSQEEKNLTYLRLYFSNGYFLCLGISLSHLDTNELSHMVLRDGLLWLDDFAI